MLYQRSKNILMSFQRSLQFNRSYYKSNFSDKLLEPKYKFGEKYFKNSKLVTEPNYSGILFMLSV